MKKDKKQFTFKIQPILWANFAVNIEKNKRKNLGDDSEKLNQSRIISKLLEKLFNGKINIDLGEKFDTIGTKPKAVFFKPEMWFDAKRFVDEKEAKGEKVFGKLGGVIVKLVKAYNKDSEIYEN